MSTITKEWLQSQISAIKAVGITDSNTLQAFEIALASLEAGPAIHRWRRVTVEPYGPYPWHYGNFIGFSKPVEGIEDEYFYSAPPAPVVPDEAISLAVDGIMSTYADNQDECRKRIRNHIEDAYRAAMLQSFGNSEQLNSPVNQDGWVACSDRMPENDDFVYIWPRPDFGVELHVAQYGKFDKRDAGWYAQVCEQNYGIEYYPVKVTHWMPLPAAPQQEVK